MWPRRAVDWSYLVAADDAPAKRAILKAALRLFVEKGLAATSIRDIASSAGFTNPALFKHFSGRDALAMHLFERSLKHFARELSAARSEALPFRENLRATLAVFLRTMDQNLDAWLFVQDNLRTFWPQMPSALRAVSPLSQVRELLAQGVREGCVNAKRELALLVAAFAGFFSQFSRMLHFGEFEGDALGRLDDVEHLLVAMLR